MNWWLDLNPARIASFARFLIVRTMTALAIFFVFWLIALLAEILINRAFRSRSLLSHDLLALIATTSKMALLTFGCITALGTAGINVSALVAGLGLTGFALGFAFRDVLSNVLAGFLILLYRPFVRGDWINVTGLEGTVLQIDLRYTTLDSADKKILIPNANLFTNPIVIGKAPVNAGSRAGLS